MKGGIRFSLQFAITAVICGSLVFLAWQLAGERLYATSLVVVIAFAAVVIGFARRLQILDRSLASMLGGRADEVATHSPLTRAALPRSISALAARETSSSVARVETQRGEQYLQALLDTVSAALFVAGPGPTLQAANRAAARLDSLVDSDVARELRALQPGSRSIVTLGAGVRHLALAAQFRAPGQATQRLLSIQPIAGELDLVEIEAWRNMTRVLAHEMMNSLTPIVSLSESLNVLLPPASMPQDDARVAIEAIHRRSVGLLNFVQRYRQMSDLPAPVMAPVKLDDFIAGLSTLMGGRLREKNIDFRCSVAESDLVVSADAELLTQALINLLTNAIEAAPPVEPRVELRCQREGEAIAIYVRDNGPGISEAEREQIFVPFHTTKPGGSGIGLSLARQIAIAHGGRLELMPGSAGCEFRMTLGAPYGFGGHTV